MSIPELKKFEFPARLTQLSVVLIVIGALSFVVALTQDPQRAWANFLMDYFYWLSICLAGIFFSALHYMAGSNWGVVVRRVAERFLGFLPVAMVLFVILIFGVHYLYEWSHAEVMANDHLLQAKAAYLNQPFFIVRGLLLFAIVFFLGGKIAKNSLKQDETGDPHLTIKNVRLSAPFLFLFGWGFSFASFDLMMSLSPHWFSTIFGVYCWSGLFFSGLAMILIWVIALKRAGYLEGFVNENHYHDLGKLMFAFCVFWAYVGFSQFMLIWYGNLPEETFYYIDRMKGGWLPVSIALMICKFGLPFFFIISRFAKRNEKWMLFVASWFLGAQLLDVYWMVFPTFYKSPVFGWMEPGIFVGFAGLFLLSVGKTLEKKNIVPIQDPWLEESLHHHQ